MPSNIGSFYLFDKIMDFHKKYPAIEITIMTGSTTKLIELLDAHIVDFIVDTEPFKPKDNDMIVEKLTDVSYAFIVKKDSQIEEIEKIRCLKDLQNKQLILPVPNTANRLALDTLLFHKGIEFENVLNIHTSEMIISAVKKDLGIGYVIENLLDNETRALKLEETLPKVGIIMCYRKAYLTPASKTFVKEYMHLSISL